MTGHATINGLRMYYEEEGSGPVLLLLHGGGSTAESSFGAIMPALARSHHVIAPEQQAHGHSGDREGPLSQLKRLLPHADLAVLPGSRHGAYLGAAEGGPPGSALLGVGTTMIESFLAAKL